MVVLLNSGAINGGVSFVELSHGERECATVVLAHGGCGLLAVAMRFWGSKVKVEERMR